MAESVLLRPFHKDSLAAEIYEVQAKLNFPGLVSEFRELLKYYGLPDIIDEKISVCVSKKQWKSRVKKAFRERSQINLQIEFETYSKLRNKGY